MSDHQTPATTCNAVHHAHGGASQRPIVTSAHATLHCLIGCTIGEVLGLVIGVLVGLGVWLTIGLAVLLAFVFGLSLAVIPVMRGQGLALLPALKAIWIGEVISIAVMEAVMNGVDLAIIGVQAMSLSAPIFWIGLAVAIPAGFLAAWPVNHLLITRQLKACAH